ncbi:MAG: biotin transporter BioY [Acidobacteriota bacterium]
MTAASSPGRGAASGGRLFVPLAGLRSPGALACALLGGALLTAAGARVDVPMTPVPMSLQTYAVVLFAGLAGWRLGGGAQLLYLLCGALGAPVFADGAAGWSHLAGSTAGYLFGFVLTGVFVGALAERGHTAHFLRSTSTMLAGHLVTLGLGALILGLKTDWATAYGGGFQPFLLGGLVKSALAAATILLLRGLLARAPR